jgi:hypothetical protein
LGIRVGVHAALEYAYVAFEVRRDRAMTDIAPGWEIIAQKTRNPVAHMVFILLQILLLHAEPLNRSNVTFTVRHRETGETRTITARSRTEAAARIEEGRFDPA